MAYAGVTSWVAVSPETEYPDVHIAYVRIRLGHIGKWIGVLERLLARVERPSGDMHLFAQRGRIRLHERVHVLPAVQVAHTADFRLRHRLGRVAGTVAEDQALDVCGPDLAAVVGISPEGEISTCVV